MDAKVDISNVLPGDHPSTDNAARWLRQHLDISPECTIFNEFERHFDCQIQVQDLLDPWMQPDQIVFRTQKDLLAFVLRWS